MMKRYHRKSSGFTIIELLIATVVFTVILVVLLAAFVQISRLYYKGINLTRTQEDSRTIVQDLSDDIKFATNASPSVNASYDLVKPANNTGVFCVGQHRYRYDIGKQIQTSTDYGLSRDTISSAAGCPDTGTVPVNSATDEALLDYGMQLNKLSIACAGGRCLINIHVVFYGGTPDKTMFSTSNGNFSTVTWLAPDAECTGSLSDSQYCATSDYQSAVLQRQ